MASTQVSNTTSAQGNSTHPSAYMYLAAWALVLIVLFGLSRTKIGYVVIYYTLILAIVFLIVTQYNAIGAVLAPITTQQPAASAPSGGGGGAASGGGGSAGSF